MDADGGCGCPSESTWFAFIVAVAALCAAAAIVIHWWPLALIIVALVLGFVLGFLYLLLRLAP